MSFNIHQVLMNSNQGTWQFMAADLIADPTISQRPIYDLESLFFVMFWLSLKYLPNSHNPSLRGAVLSTAFNPDPLDTSRIRSSADPSSRPVEGLCGRANWLANSSSFSKFKVTGNDPLSDLLLSLKSKFGRRHTNPDTLNDFMENLAQNDINIDGREERIRKYRKDLNHDEVLKMLDTALAQQWPDDDPARLQKIRLPAREQRSALSGSKRSRSMYFASHNSLPVHSEPSEPSSSKQQK